MDSINYLKKLTFLLTDMSILPLTNLDTFSVTEIHAFSLTKNSHIIVNENTVTGYLKK